jgi:anti-sigma B factor antagonist
VPKVFPFEIGQPPDCKLIFTCYNILNLLKKCGGSRMNITTTELKHCDLIKVSGRIDSSTASQLADAISALVEKGQYKIVLDMGEVEFMSSAGLRVLVNAQKTCRRYNRGELALAAVPKNIMAALDLTGFIPLFKFFDDALVAVGNF